VVKKVKHFFSKTVLVDGFWGNFLKKEGIKSEFRV